jgi:transcription-repair coupling factor (superfamily II helicase)
MVQSDTFKQLVSLLDQADASGRDNARAGADAERISAGGLWGSSRAYLVSRCLHLLKRPMVVLVPGAAEARQFTRELRFFLGAIAEGEGLPWDPEVVFFPGWDPLPSEGIMPHPETSARRVSALFRASTGGPFVLVAQVDATFQRLCPPKKLEAAAIELSVGGTIERDAWLEELLRNGYRRVGQVEERGEVSARGGIVDLFAPHYPHPLRIELFGDEIESLRTFDIATQRSSGKLKEALVLPAREVVADAELAKEALKTLRRRCHKLGMNRTETADALEVFRADSFAPERECFLPYFMEETASFWDYIPADAVVVEAMSSELGDRVASFAKEGRNTFERAAHAKRLTPTFDELMFTEDEWRAARGGRTVLALDELQFETAAAKGGERVSFVSAGNDDLAQLLRRSRGSERLLAPLVERIEADRSRGHRVLLACKSPGSAQKMHDFLSEYGLELPEATPFSPPTADELGTVGVCIGDIERGFGFPGEKFTLITDTEVFGRKGRRPRLKRRGFSSSLGELSPGDHIVHVDFGIGLYQGMVRLEVEDDESDYLLLEYAGGDRLYLPVTKLNLVKGYTAPGEGKVKLDKLGGVAWERARKKAAEGIEAMAHQLLDLYARRALATRPSYGKAGLSFREFEATFPFEETPDQLSAIADLMKDLVSDKPMDRLICGDVGYGKTEVAIRAAFLAVDAGKQVAILAPTTVLAAQHLRSFKKRFEGYPINVEMLSRFVTKEEQNQTVAGLKKGVVDVVIGTHRLVQSDIKFKDLGLIVIDEEHRFGVAQKERLKKLRNQVDVLALSATPIPRSLQMGLTGARDLSVIETPPADRLAVRTRMARFDDDIIKEAIGRELGRGGQVYFVHNRVQSIAELADYLRELLPGVRFGVGHGQMKEIELQKVMEEFTTGELDVLVCTAIIESGLDIPRANTMLIDHADMFGLADLYQLRGRVGRSDIRAHCLLLIGDEGEITDKARKRLSALQQFTELGAGFKVAIHDLEIRGAGEMLGKNQSGQIAAIGFDLYAQMLDDAVHRLRGEPHGRPPEPEIKLRLHAHFPEQYVPDAPLRLSLYERLTRMESDEELSEAVYELTDRFGPVPPPVTNLLEVMKLRLKLMSIRGIGLNYSGERLVLSFDDAPGVDPEKVIALVTSMPGKVSVTPDNRVRWKVGKLEGEAILAAAHELLSKLL